MPTVDKTVGQVAIANKNKQQCRPARRRSAEGVPAQYRNRPASIRGAIYRVWDHSVSLGFTKTTTAVLQAILAAGVSADHPFEPVFAKKATLAKMARCSEVSVYRAMRALENDGWIKRTNQGRLEDGSLDIGLVAITEKLAMICCLVVSYSDAETGTGETSGQQSSDDQLEPQATAAAPGATPVLKPSAPAKISLDPDSKSTLPTSDKHQMKDGLPDGPIYRDEQWVYRKASVNHQSTQSGYVRIDGRSVAQELVWLIQEKRLTFGGLFQLQKMAKRVPGQQLSDFVAYRSERLKQLPSANDCYRYLKKLIEDGLDARFLCAERAKRDHQASRRQQRDAAVANRESWMRARHEKTYINPETHASYRINANHGLLEVGENGEPSNKPCLKLTSKFIKAVEEGRLVPFFQPTTAIDRNLGNRRLDELGAKFPWLRRKTAVSLAD